MFTIIPKCKECRGGVEEFHLSNTNGRIRNGVRLEQKDTETVGLITVILVYSSK